MKEEYFYDIANEESVCNYLSKMDEKTLLIFSPTSLDKANFNNKRVKSENWHNISKNIEKIDKYIKTLGNIKEIVTFGGGSSIDIGKYISYKLKIKYTCIPSMLSTNSYATNKVALIKNNKKITIEAKMPDKIIIDHDILKLSKKENLYGLADVLSIYTALYDWKIADKDINEKIDIDIYIMAEKLLNEVLEFMKGHTLDEIISDNMKLFNFIGVAGYITNLYGTGRPESGSEHIMAKEIEKRIDIPHGMSVSIGILVMSLLQDRYNQDILEAIKKMKIFENSFKYGLTKEIIKSSFLDLKSREDRYSIVNRYEKDNKSKEKILEKFFEIVNIGDETC